MASKNKLASARIDRLFEKILTMEPVSEVLAKCGGGVEYVYDPGENVHKSNWRQDGWHWRQNATYTYTMLNGKTGPVPFKKIPFYCIVGPEVNGTAPITKLFTRDVFFHPTIPDRVLIVYNGDEKNATEHSHGNAKSDKKKAENFVPTREQTKEELKATTGLPINEYRDACEKGSSDLNRQAFEQPRDVVQVRNFQYNERKKLAITQDINYNLQEIADDTKFIREIISYPDVAIFMYHPHTWELFRGLLNRSDIPFISLSVDTTFEMTDGYVTALVARFVEFNESPVFPLATMIHERKLNETHRFFWRKVTEHLPNLVTASNIYIVSDEEEAIVGGIKEFMPNTDAYRCWNHIITNAKLKLKRLKITKDDVVDQYVDDIWRLLGQETAETYYKELAIINGHPDRWHPEFKKYFMDRIDSKIDRTGRWIIKKHNLTSVTTNISESFNALMKRNMEWIERPIDALCVALYRLAKSFVTEIIRGRYKKGNYTLRPSLAHLYNLRDNPPDPEMLKKGDTEKEIFDRIRNAKDARKKLLEADIKQEGAEQDEILDHEITTWERAQYVVSNELIKLDVKTHSFIVTGSAENRLVTLFPKVTCTCPSTTTCYHVLAAQIAIGYQSTATKRPKNSTRYRKRAKKAADKRSGTKAPRTQDVDRPSATSPPSSPSKDYVVRRCGEFMQIIVMQSCGVVMHISKTLMIGLH